MFSFVVFTIKLQLLKMLRLWFDLRACVPQKTTFQKTRKTRNLRGKWEN